MKKVLVSVLFMLICAFLPSDLLAQSKNQKTTSSTKVEVLYFHATNRCPTCNAVEKNAKKVLDEKFKTQLNSGEIQFNSLNLDENANKALVEKYKVSYSTLLIIKKNGAKESFVDLTDAAFQYARTNPAKYATLLKTEIDKNLK